MFLNIKEEGIPLIGTPPSFTRYSTSLSFILSFIESISLDSF